MEHDPAEDLDGEHGFKATGEAVKAQRCLTPEFVQYMHREKGWPNRGPLEHAFRGRGFGWNNWVFTNLRMGDSMKEKDIAGFLSVVRDADDQDAHFGRCRRVLSHFLQRKGVASPNSVDLPALLGLLCYAPSHAPSNGRKAFKIVDFLLQPLRATLGRFVAGHFKEHVAGFSHDEDLSRLVRAMYIRFSHMVSVRGHSVSDKDALDLATSVIGLTVEEYLDRARTWMSHHPWTVVRAVANRSSVGVSIVLPLKEAAYQRVRMGAMPSSDCRTSDFEYPSKFLLIEACAEDPEVLRRGENPTMALMACLVMQCASLTRLQRLAHGETIRWLSFAATPTNRDRLLKHGFSPTGTRMARTDLEVLERVVTVADNHDWFENAILRHGGTFWGETPPIDLRRN